MEVVQEPFRKQLLQSLTMMVNTILRVWILLLCQFLDAAAEVRVSFPTLTLTEATPPNPDDFCVVLVATTGLPLTLDDPLTVSIATVTNDKAGVFLSLSCLLM